MQVMKCMPRIDESRKRKAEGGPSYGKKSKTDTVVLSASCYHCTSFLIENTYTLHTGTAFQHSFFRFLWVNWFLAVGFRVAM